MGISPVRKNSLFLSSTQRSRITVFNLRELFTMPCHLRYTIFMVLLHATIGFVISLIVFAPFYFSTKWCEKYTIEKVIMIGCPCVGAFLGFINGQRDVDPEATRMAKNAPRLERQQRASRVSESAQLPKSPQIRNQPTRTLMMRRGMIPTHLHPTLM